MSKKTYKDYFNIDPKYFAAARRLKQMCTLRAERIGVMVSIL